MAVTASAPRPQLVVGIVVDGLDPQYLDLLSPHFGQGGFNRLMREGVTVANADYGTNLDAAATAAVLMTGASPSTTAVIGATVYEPDALRERPAMWDPATIGNYTDQTFSATPLAVSTLSDECRIAGGGVTRSYSIAADPTLAVILAGHSSNAALWLNDKNGNWATSGYYKDPPTALMRRNRLAPLAVRLDTMQWTPLRKADAYPGLPEHLTHYPFRYVFSRGNADRYAMMASSPLINAEITDVASELISDMKLGEADGVDMVNLCYTLEPFDYTKNGDNRYELMDSYLRLDAQLERLFRTVEGRLGPDKAMFYLAATPPARTSRRDPEQWGVPFGEFSTKKARSLLNMYLMGIFGNGEWIQAFHDGQFYLNQKLIKDRGVEARAVRAQAAQLLSRMSGVDRVHTIDDILAAPAGSELEGLRRSIDPAAAGDLYLEVDPGWEIVDDMLRPVPSDRIQYVKRLAPATAPVYIMGPGLEPRVISTPVDARTIAPTVARVLRIRSPNAASMPALVL